MTSLLNTPGESSSVITAIEGSKMAKAGRAAQALATAAIGSFVAGMGGGDWTAIFSEPVGNVTYALIVLLIASPFVVGLIRRKRMEPTVQELIEKERETA